MQELKWLDHLPEQSLAGGMRLLEQLRWHLSVNEEHGVWIVRTGDQPLLRADSKDSVDSFLYGLALAFSVLPEGAREEFHRYMLSCEA